MATRPSEELIIDRTLNDVMQNNAKGNYNISDLNRIKKWQIYLKDIINEKGYYVSPLVIHDDWVITDLPHQSEINDIKNNITKLRNGYFVLRTTPQTPSTERDYITYSDANDIEKIFRDIEFLVNSNDNTHIYSGVANSGQPRIWQARFRNKRTWNGTPFNTFSQMPNTLQLLNISAGDDETETYISSNSGVYGTIKNINERYNYIDSLTGGINE